MRASSFNVNGNSEVFGSHLFLGDWNSEDEQEFQWNVCMCVLANQIRRSVSRRCSCPCPAPLPSDSPWPNFSIGTWPVDPKYSPPRYPGAQQQSIPDSGPTYFPQRSSYGLNDSGIFSTSPVSTNSDSSNSMQNKFHSLTGKECPKQHCDVITETLNQLTLQETTSSVCPASPYNVQSESPVIPSRYVRWAGIAVELEAWEKRLSNGWSNGQIPRSQLSSFVEFLRRLRLVVRRKSEEGLDLCAFCRNNGEPFDVYISHKVRNSSGQVTCPILRLLSCPLCKSTGDQAHTIKYCPYRKKAKEAG